MKRYSPNPEGRLPKAVVVSGHVYCRLGQDPYRQDMPVMQFHIKLHTQEGSHEVTVELALDRGDRSGSLPSEDIKAITQMAVERVNEAGALVPLTIRNGLYRYIKESSEVKSVYQRAVAALDEQAEAESLAEVLF